jgi:hypothetical protein
LKNFDTSEKWSLWEHSIYGTGGQIRNDNLHLFSGLISPLLPGSTRIKQERLPEVAYKVWMLGIISENFRKVDIMGISFPIW